MGINNVLSTISSGTYFPNCINTWTTLIIDNSEGLKQFNIDNTNLPAGTIINISFQTKLGLDQPFREFKSAVICVPVDIPSAPSHGYQPVETFEFNGVFFGFQVQTQVISGKLPTKGLYWALYVLH